MVALDGPFTILFEEQRPDEADDGVIVGEDADDVSAPLERAIHPLAGVRGMQLGLVFL